MAGIIVSGGAYEFVHAYSQYIVDQGMEVRLYKNNYTPVITSTLGNFTAATFPGYTPQVISGATTRLGETGTVGQDEEVLPLVVFTRTSGAGSETIYGYYLYSSAAGDLMGAEKFIVPIVIATLGQSILISIHTFFQDISV